MLRRCSREGCGILTLGELCAAHEAAPSRTAWPRGRPFLPELLPVPPGLQPTERAFLTALAQLLAHGAKSPTA
jgi:hypothetical protein